MGNKNIFIDFIHKTIRRLGKYFQKKKKTLFTWAGKKKKRRELGVVYVAML